MRETSLLGFLDHTVRSLNLVVRMKGGPAGPPRCGARYVQCPEPDGSVVENQAECEASTSSGGRRYHEEHRDAASDVTAAAAKRRDHDDRNKRNGHARKDGFWPTEGVARGEGQCKAGRDQDAFHDQASVFEQIELLA